LFLVTGFGGLGNAPACSAGACAGALPRCRSPGLGGLPELLAPNGGAVVLGQPAPDAVLDAPGQGLVGTVGLDRAAVADLEGTGNVEWGLRGEEQVGFGAASAGGGHVPVGGHHAATP